MSPLQTIILALSHFLPSPTLKALHQDLAFLLNDSDADSTF